MFQINSRSLRTRVCLFVGSVVIFSSLAIVFVMTTMTRNLAKQNAMDNANETAKRYAAVIETQLNKANATTRAMANSIEAMAAGESKDRKQLNMLMYRVLKQNPDFLADWLIFEPNAFDGKDAKYVNTPYGNEKGRYTCGANVALGKLVADVTDETELVPGNGDYYLAPRDSKQETFMAPYDYAYYPNTPSFWETTIAIPIFDASGKKLIGVCGTDVNLKQLTSFVNKVKPYGTGYAAVIANDGTYVAHPNKKLYGKKFNGQDTAKILDSVKAGKPLQITEFSKALKTQAYTIFVPIRVGKTLAPWSLAITVPMNKVMAPADRIGNLGLLIGLIFLAIALTAIGYIAKTQVAKPLNNVTNMLKDIAEGDGDLTKELEVTGKDEIAELCTWFNVFVGKIRNIIGETAHSAHVVARCSNDLARTAQSIGVSTHQIAETVEHMAEDAQEQSNLVDRGCQTVEGLSKSIDNVASGAQTQASSVNDVVNLIQQVNSAIGQIVQDAHNVASISRTVRETADNGALQASSVISGMARIKESSGNATDLVMELDSNSHKISMIVETISDIAEQTNLLALNAAIEAARVGEYGKGFAVVADEVRKLAESSASAAGQITELITNVQQMTHRVVDAMQQNNHDVENGTQLGQQTEEALNSISKAATQSAEKVESLSSKIEQIADANSSVVVSVEQVAGVAENSAAVAEEMSAQSEELNDHISSIAHVTEQNAAAAQEVAATTQEQSAAMTELLADSKKLSEMSEELRQLVGQFKLPENNAVDTEDVSIRFAA